MPAMTERDGRVLIAWKETVEGENRVLYALVAAGCVGSPRRLADPIPDSRRPAVAAIASGWVLAYEAQCPPKPLIRAVFLDSDGEVMSGPETVSTTGETASRVRLAAQGDDVVFSWTNVHAHFIARRGPVERLLPTPVGSTLVDAGLINFPRVALGSDGTLYVAYRDGGPKSVDYEVLLLVREVGQPFEQAVEVSRSAGRRSDDVAMAIESDDRLRLVWVEQNGKRPDTFEVVHATYDREQGIGDAVRFGTLGLISAKPSVTTGLATAWHAGSVRSGRLFFASGPRPPTRILPDFQGGMVSLVGDPAGALHLAFVDAGEPPRLRYTWRRGGPGYR